MHLITEAQQKLLIAAGESKLNKHVYFTGGTLLSFHYLKHRRSLDLDFFSDDLLDDLLVSEVIKDISSRLNIKEARYNRFPSRSQYFLTLDDEEIKFEIAYFPFPRIGRRIYLKDFNLEADSLRDIAVNKVHACFERDAPRDMFDLYSIMKAKKWTLQSLLKDVERKFGVVIDLAHLAARLLAAVDKLDEVKPLFIKLPPDRSELRQFFEKASYHYLSSKLK